MADIEIFKIDNGPAIKSIAELRENIKALKDALNDSNLTWEQQQQYVKELGENQAALRNAMHATTGSFEDVTAAAKGFDVVLNANGELANDASVSYNQLVRQLAILKEQWRSTSDEGKRADLGKQINAINNRLKTMDASVGNYQRNVGMYSTTLQSLAAAFQTTAGKAGGMVNPLRNVTSGLKAMGATPVIAIMGLLANVLSKVINALKSSEEGLEGATAAMGVFGGISDAITAILQNVAKGVGFLATQFVNLLDKLGLVNERMKENKAIAEEEIRVARMQREAVMQNADAERDIAELRAKSVDKEKYSAKERIAFLEEANAKQEAIANRAREAAKAEYELIVRKNKQTKSSAEAMKAEADAYARMVQADTNYQNAVRQNLRESERVKKEMDKEEQDRRKADAATRNARLALEKDFLKQELSLLEEGSQAQLDKQIELSNKEYEIAVASAKDKITNKEDLNKQLLLLEQMHEKELITIQDDFETKRREKAEADAKAQAEAEAEALKKAEENAKIAKENEYFNFEESSMQALANEVALKEYELNTLHQLEDESNEAFRKRELEAEKAFYDAKKKQRDAWVNTMMAASSAVSGILGSIADMYEANTEMTEEEAKKAKNLRIASATIDMLQGAVTAYAGAQTLGVPMGPILGAINAAAVIATGIANIAKIRATDVNKNSSSSASATTATAASVSAPSVQPNVTETRAVTSASEQDILNRAAGDKRVYILSSDLEADREDTKAQVEQTTW